MTAPTIKSQWERTIGPTHTPPESAFLDAFCNAAVDHGYGVARRASRGAIGVQPHYRLGPYFLDFHIGFVFFGEKLEIAVEIDGRDLHEKTNEQVSRDKRRDRIIEVNGFYVFRFSDRDVIANPERCVMEVLDMIMNFQSVKIYLTHRNALKRTETGAS